MSAQGVFTPEYRVEFIESEDCGDGTEFPLLVTLDQLAEILYRVRDAWFTAGELTYTLAGFPISISTADPPSVGALRVIGDLVSGDEILSARGYFVEDTAVVAPWEPYFGEAYTPSYPTIYVRDVSDNERALWIPSTELTWGSPSFPYTAGSIEWGTAFAHFLYSYGNTSSSTD